LRTFGFKFLAVDWAVLFGLSVMTDNLISFVSRRPHPTLCPY